jgi:hypothetical protein
LFLERFNLFIGSLIFIQTLIIVDILKAGFLSSFYKPG